MSNLSELKDVLGAVDQKTDAVIAKLEEFKAAGAGALQDSDLADVLALAKGIKAKEDAELPDAAPAPAPEPAPAPVDDGSAPQS